VISSDSEAKAAPSSAAQYLTFFIAGEEYAVGLDHVREVIPYDTVTRVPGMPRTVRGVTNLRGSVVPVVDLAIKFRLPEIPVTARTCIVLVEAKFDESAVLIGLLTEEVGQVLALAAEALLPAPSFGAPVRTDFLAGMAQVGKKFALVLDVERVLSRSELLTERDLEALEPAGTPDAAASPSASSETDWEIPDAEPDAAEQPLNDAP
jgi:purine-binding chemotaxis protein CheW